MHATFVTSRKFGLLRVHTEDITFFDKMCQIFKAFNLQDITTVENCCSSKEEF